MLRGEEVEMLVCGSQTFTLSELRKVTEYDGFNADEEFIELVFIQRAVEIVILTIFLKF